MRTPTTSIPPATTTTSASGSASRLPAPRSAWTTEFPSRETITTGRAASSIFRLAPASKYDLIVLLHPSTTTHEEINTVPSRTRRSRPDDGDGPRPDIPEDPGG